MKTTISLIVVVVLAIFLLPADVQAQEKEGQAQGFAFDFSGFTNIQSTGDGFDLGWTRLFPSVRKGRWELAFELEGQWLDDPNGWDKPEWLSQANLTFHWSENLSLQFGRSFRAFGYATVAPIFLKTAVYPAGYPYGGFYAYGVRVNYARRRWSVKADVVADPEGFRETDFAKPEVSFFVERSFGEGLSIGASGRTSGSLTQGGVHFVAKTENFHVFGGVFANDGKRAEDKNLLSSLLFAEWQVLSWLHPHTLIAVGGDGDVVWTNGVAVIYSRWERELKFIVDHDGNRFLARTQIRF